MTAQRPAQTYCPYCDRSLATVGKVTDEHVVSRFLGGLRTVACCKTCNDALGGGVEGRLSNRSSWLTILSQAEGLTEGHVLGRNERNQRTRHHFGHGAHEWTTPAHEVEVDTDEVTKVVIAAPPHVQSGYAQHLAKVYGGELHERGRVPAPAEWAHIDVVLTIDDLIRLTAKSVLSGGAYAWGDTFLRAPAADWLRRLVDVGRDWPTGQRDRPVSDPPVLADGTREAAMESMLKQMKSSLEPILRRATSSGVEHPQARPPAIVIMTPVAGGRAFMSAVHALRIILPILPVPHPIPGQSEPEVVVLSV